MLLGKVGAGLNWANKRAPVGLKVKAFLYAAVALREYLALHDVAWPRTGQVANLA